jgi:anti-sigma-K factor RskA
MEKISEVQIHTVAPQEGLKNRANRNSMKTVAIPTLEDLDPSWRVGVSVTTAAAANMQTAIPATPMRRRGLRPRKSVIQVAFRVKRMLKVPPKALMSWIWLFEVKTFL